MDLVSSHGVFRKQFLLLGGSELNRAHCIAGHGVTKEHVFETLVITNVIVVWNVNTKRAALGSKANNFEGGKIRC